MNSEARCNYAVLLAVNRFQKAVLEPGTVYYFFFSPLSHRASVLGENCIKRRATRQTWCTTVGSVAPDAPVLFTNIPRLVSPRPPFCSPFLHVHAAAQPAGGAEVAVQVCKFALAGGIWEITSNESNEFCAPNNSHAQAFELLSLWPWIPAPLSLLTLLRCSSAAFVHVPFFSSTHTKPASKASAWRAYMNNNGALTQSRRRGRNRNTNNCLLQCDTSHTPGMIWMLNTRWLMHECGAGATNWKWDYNATAAAENTAVRGIVMHT